MKWLHQTAMVLVASTVLLSCTKSIQQETDVRSELLVAGKKDQAQKFNTFKGPQQKLGSGKVRTFATISHTGIPVEVGVEISADALSGLPNHPINLILSFHNKASVTPFTHVFMNWNPQGHPPIPGPYLVPHFDLHFYMISNSQRMAISATDPKIDAIPSAPLWPNGYVPTPGGEPEMGKHWIAPSSPEICCAQPFTHTMIYGSYDGKFIFIEPMITRAYLLSGASVTKAFSPLKQFIVSNSYYPSTYKVYKEGADHVMSLTNFEKH